MGIFKYFVLRNSRLEPENGVSYKKTKPAMLVTLGKKNNVLLVKIKSKHVRNMDFRVIFWPFCKQMTLKLNHIGHNDNFKCGTILRLNIFYEKFQ